MLTYKDDFNLANLTKLNLIVHIYINHKFYQGIRNYKLVIKIYFYEKAYIFSQ